MEVDESVDKMIEQLDESIKGKIVENGTEKVKVEETDVVKNEEDLLSANNIQDSVNDIKGAEETVVEDKPKEAEVDTIDKVESKQKAAVNADTENESAESTETKTESGNIAKKSRRVRSKPAELDRSAVSSDESPSKRQRKPKVFEDESVPKTPKSPTEKSVKPKFVITPEMEAKYPGKVLFFTLEMALLNKYYSHTSY